MKALHSLWFKPIAASLILTMLCYDVTWASPAGVSSGFQNVSPPFASHFPAEFGRVEEILPSRNGKVSAPLIYHLQDAHAIYEAQSNLAGILETLIQKEGVSLVLVEGGSGNVSLTSLRRAAWKTVRRGVAKESLRSGKISGEEYLQVATDYPFELIGIEDETLYRRNLEVFLRALRRKPEAIRKLTQIESRVRSLEAKLYSPQFRELERMRGRWQKGEGNLLQYVSHLRGAAEEKEIETASYQEWNKLSNLEKGIDPSSFDQNTFFQELKEIENKVRSEFLADETARHLWEISESLRLLKKLFNFELTSDEYEQLLNTNGKVNVEGLVSGLEAVSGSQSLAGIQNAARFLDEEKGLFLQFYELAGKRDQAFMRNIKRILKEHHPRKAVLITGGFHSKHLGELFKQKGISRILISPGISQIDEGVDSHYEKILREKTRSTLRAPATLGTPYFTDLKIALEREQSVVMKKHVQRLIGYLDVDGFLEKSPVESREDQSTRSELRELHEIANILAELSNNGTAVLWGGLAGVAVLGAGYLWHLHRRKRPEATQAGTLESDILPGPLADHDEPLFLQPFEESLGGEEYEGAAESIAIKLPARSEARNASDDLAKALGEEARRFFEGSFPVVPSREDLPPPPHELPLPIPADAIPQDQDARGKAAFILQEVFQAMETMDGHMRSQQKESAERALRRVLEEGEIDPQKYRQYLQEDLQQFFRGIADEIKKMNSGPGDGAHLTVSEEIEESYPRFPRLVKYLLSEHPELLDDAEIKTLMSRISGKFTGRPPVAPDIEDYVERSYERLRATPAPQPQDQSIAARPVSKPEPAPVRPARPKKTVDSERIKAQLRDLERMHEKLQGDERKLNLEIQKVETEQRELTESLDQARADRDKVIEEALQTSVEAYESRLRKLRASRGELAGRLNQISAEADRLRALLADDDGGGTTARSEVRVLALSAVLIGAGLVAAGAVYLGEMYRANKNAKALIASKEGAWKFERERIYKETVPLKEAEKVDLFTKKEKYSPDPASWTVFAWIGAVAGWIIGGWALYQAYHGWEWETSRVLIEPHQKDQSGLTLGAVLWLLEVIVPPIVGFVTGAAMTFIGQVTYHAGRPFIRMLRFPFDYERALRLHLLPYDSLSPSEISQSVKFLSRMEKETLEVILQNWVKRGEHEKIKAFSEKGIWQGEKKKFIQLYEDVAGLEQAKQLLIDSFASKDEHKEAIAEFIRRWKTALDRKKLNGTHLLKDLIPEVAKTEKTFKGVRSWIERLITDPATPWKGGVSQAKAHYEILNKLDRLKAEAASKFTLTEEDKAYLDSQIEGWEGRIPSGEKVSPGAYEFLGVILEKAIQVSQNKAGFSFTLKKILEINPVFRPSKREELLALFDQIISYEILKARLYTETEPKEKEALVALISAIEAPLGGVPHPATVFRDPFTKLSELPAPARMIVLQDFHDLDPAIFNGDPKQISRVFDILTVRERARSKLIALDDGVSDQVRRIESKATFQTLDDLTNLTDFYILLTKREDSEVQRFLLNLTARAPPGVFPVFIRSREAILSYYLSHRNGRDYGQLGALADSYRRSYRTLEFLTETVLDHLTDPDKPERQRIEEARKTLDGQKLIKLGYPGNVIETRDAVSMEAVINALSSNGGEDLLKNRAGNPVVKSALSKMGRLGLYSYWESSRPAYYLQFLEDTKGLAPDFFRPGEKLRVAYDGETAVQRKAGSLDPVSDPVHEMKALVAALRLKHPNIYENFIAPKRELLNGKPLEHVIDEKTFMAVAKQFKNKVPDWPFSGQEKTGLILRIHEILFAKEIQPLLGQRTAEEETAYWKAMLRLFSEKSGLKKDSVLARSAAAQVKRRIDELTEEAGTGREGVVQFILTRGTVSDFVRGEISEDCCSEHRNLHFNDTVGLPTDPAFLSFKLVENEKWIGNIYSIVLKDQDGKFIFYLDNMPVSMSHPGTSTQAKADKLINGFYQKLKELLETNGFDYFVMAPDPSSREKIRTALRALGGEDQSKTTTKPGGYGHKTEFSVSSEYIQGLGTLSSSISANGKWIALDNREAKERRRQAEIQALQKTLQAADTERKQLEKTKATKATQIRHLKERSQNAAEKSKTTTAQALRSAAQQGETELSRIIAEINALEGQITAAQAKLQGLNESSHSSRSEVRTLSVILAQFNPANGPLQLLLFLSIAGLLGWIGWELLKGWLWGYEKEEQMREPETYRPVERETNPAFIPAPERPVWFRHPLVMEVTDLFKQVLKKVSKEMRPLIPERLFFPIPYDLGMRLPERIIKTLSAARTVLTALRDRDSLIPFIKKQAYYESFKERTAVLGLRDDFDAPGPISTFHMQTRQGKEVTFSLELSDRTADDLLKGDVSRDCTGLGACAAFYETIPQFLLDPGFLNFKLRMDGKWVGNIYLMVAEKDGKPVLVVDAVQLPPAQNHWPIHPTPIAQAAVHQVVHWAREQNFDRVLMSSFVSNFTYLYDYFNAEYPREVIEIEKLGGFEHLKTLGLWNSEDGRNQYIETFSPHWNQPLEGVDANQPKQNLSLRPIWAAESLESAPEPAARSEVRSQDSNWTIQGFDLEVPNSDIEALKQIPGLDDKTLLDKAFQSPLLKVSSIFHDAGFVPGMKIRMRVHDEDGKRIYKLIIVTPKGRRNFILTVDAEKAVFQPLRQYPEDLNLVDTAIMTAQAQGQVVGARNIFRKWGDPSDTQGHEIPLHGTIFVTEAKEESKPESQLKVFDLKIRGHAKPSIRTAIKPGDTDLKTGFGDAKAVYAFLWDEKKYLMGIYSLDQAVRLVAGEEAEQAAEPLSDVSEVFEDTSISLMMMQEPEAAAEIPLERVAPEAETQPEVPEKVSEPPSDQPTEEEPRQPEIRTKDVLSSMAASGALGLGAKLPAAAQKLAQKVRDKKLGEKVNQTKEKVKNFERSAKDQRDEAFEKIESLDTAMSVKEIMDRVRALKEELKQRLSGERSILETEINAYKNLPAYAAGFEELKSLFEQTAGQADQAVGGLEAAVRAKLRQKLELTKNEMHELGKRLIEDAEALVEAMGNVSLDLSPEEVDRKTLEIQEEFVEAAARKQQAIQDLAEGFHLPGLEWAHEEAVAAARTVVEGANERLNALIEGEDEKIEPAKVVPEVSDAVHPDEENQAEEDLNTPQKVDAAGPEKEVDRSAEELEKANREINRLRGELDQALERTVKAEGENQNLTESNQELNQKIKDLQKAFDERGTMIENMREANKKQKTEYEKKITELEDQLEKSRQENGSVNEQAARELEAARQRVQEIEERERRLRRDGAEEIRRIRDRLRRGGENVARILAEREQVHREQLAEAEQAADARLKAALAGRDAEVAELNRIIAGLRTSLEEKERDIARLTRERDQARAMAGEFMDENRRLKEKNKELEEAGRQKDELIKALRDANQALQEEKEREKARLTKEREDEKNAKEEAQRSLKATEGKLQKAEEALKESQTRDQGEKGKTDSLASLEKEIEAAQSLLARLTADVEKNQESLAYLKEKIEEKEGYVLELDQELERQDAEHKTKSQQLETLNAQIEKEEGEFQKEQKSKKILIKEVQALEKRKAQLETEIKKLEPVKSELLQAQKNLDQAKKIRDQAEDDYRKLLAQTEAENDKLESLKARVTDAEGRVKDLEDGIQDLEAKEKRRDELIAENKRLETLISGKNQELESIQSKIRKAESDLALLKEKKESLETEIAQLTQDRDQLLAEKKKAQEEFDDLTVKTKRENARRAKIRETIKTDLERIRKIRETAAQGEITAANVSELEAMNRSLQAAVEASQEASQRAAVLLAQAEKEHREREEAAAWQQRQDELAVQREREIEEAHKKKAESELEQNRAVLREADEAHMQQIRLARETAQKSRDEDAADTFLTARGILKKRRELSDLKQDLSAYREYLSEEAKREAEEKARRAEKSFKEKIRGLTTDHNQLQEERNQLQTQNQTQSLKNQELETELLGLQERKLPEVVEEGDAPKAPPRPTPAEQLRRILADASLDSFWNDFQQTFGRSRDQATEEILDRLREAGDDFSLASAIDLIDHYGSISQARDEDKKYSNFKHRLAFLHVDPDFDQSGLSLSFQAGGETYSLALSSGTARDLVRGYVSGDCTNCGLPAIPGHHPVAPFNHYLTRHLLSPDFLNFEVRNSKGEWIGNIYAFVAVRDSKPVFFIEALQLPWDGLRIQDGMELPPNVSPRFTIADKETAKEMADQALTALKAYAEKAGFQEVWMGFISNFFPLVSEYQREFAERYSESGLPPFGRENHAGPVFTNGPKDLQEYRRREQKLDFQLFNLLKEEIDSFQHPRGFVRLWESDRITVNKADVERLHRNLEANRVVEDESDQLKDKLATLTMRLNAAVETKGGIRINSERLIGRLTEYLSIPSGSGKEGKIRQKLIEELKRFGGQEMTLPKAQRPLNLVWNIPASEGYESSIRKIGLSAHVDRTTHNRTEVNITDGFLNASGVGGNAGLDDTLGVAAIMEVLETITEKGISHPQLRIIFTVEEEIGWRGAGDIVENHPELLKDLDLLVPIDGPVLDLDSPFAVKFINVNTAEKQNEPDSVYQAVLRAGNDLGSAALDALQSAAALGMLAAGAALSRHQPKEFVPSGGDEGQFQRTGVPIAHLRANYRDRSGHVPNDSVKIEHFTLLAEWILRIAEGLRLPEKTSKAEETVNTLPAATQVERKVKTQPLAVSTAALPVKKAEVSPPAASVKTVVPKTFEIPLVQIKSMSQLVEIVTESIQFSYEKRLTTGEEYIVKIPGEPLRWIAFKVKGLEWRLYEKIEDGTTASYPLFDADRETLARGGNIDLARIEVEVTDDERIPLAQYLKPPPFMPEADAVFPESGGLILRDAQGELIMVPLLKKGIAPISENGVQRGIGFFVHPGGIPALESKSQNLSIPFQESLYDVLEAHLPKAVFVFGWHTNPGGQAKLHAAVEAEMARNGIGGLHLVVTPGKLALWDYSANGDGRNVKPRLVFESERSRVSEWSRELARHMKKFFEPDKQDSDEVPGSGYQLRGEGKEFLTEALENGEKSQPRNIKSKIQKLYFDLGTSYGLEVPGLEAFIEQSDINLVVVKPERKRNERAPPMGFGIESGRPGRDVYATFELAPKEGDEGFEVTIYVGHGIYELAEEKERLEIFAHELYQAYRVANHENPDEYPVDIDFELKIDEEIRRSEEWEPRIPRDEREDLGLLGGVERRTDAHVRARAFARLLGTPSADGIGTTYTQLLRNAYGLSRRFSAEEPRVEDPLNAIPPPGQDAFRYTQDSFENIVSAEGLQRLFEMSAYVHENKEEEVTDFLTRQIDEGRNVLLLNQNAPTPWILKDTRKIIEDLSADGKLSEIFLDLSPRIQPLIDQYLETGRSSQELLTAIAARFPPFLPREFQRPDLYENLLRAVYEHNLEAGNGGKIQVTAYYEGRRLPPMPPGQGQFPPRPGDMPFRHREDRPFQPPFQGNDEAAPPATFPGRDLPFPPGLPLPPLPLTQGVKEAFQKALSDAERRPGAAVLFLKPLDEFFPEELNNQPSVASILHIDKYTGYGPEKPENQLALYMSEQASPNQKSFALPILAEAPFFEESINPGLPKGIPFNDFNVYPDLILSTSGDGDENMDLTPDEVTPEEIGPLVPVGGRSEVRITSPDAIPVLKQRDIALKELIQIGEPAVGPLLEALTLPSVTVRLGAIQALGAIGDPRAIGPLNQLSQAVQLREAAKVAVRSIQEHPRVPLMESRTQENAEEIQTKSVRVRAPVTVSSFGEAVETLETEKSLAFIQTLLRQTSLKVDFDVESLMHKEDGRIRLSGWGFVEALKALEAKLPNKFFEKIRIRLVNLNPQIRRDEIEQALGLTPELRRIVEIINVPVRHTAFKGIEPFLEKDALKIASERNQRLWEDHADILVKEPGEEQVIDGRKLFLTALLHRNLRTRISKELRALAIRLLREIGDLPVNGVSYFNADSRSAFSLEVLGQMDQINRMLASMA